MNKRRHMDLFTSGEIAKARAKLTVATDRIRLGPGELQQMRVEILRILEKYLELHNTPYEIHLRIIHPLDRGKRDVKTIQIK